ncbi:MAG: virulence RhuM family protein [Deltaproteobacteria bacterium]|nr:virulence RhuM family protein [Deltaproteobacteria bacterium]
MSGPPDEKPDRDVAVAPVAVADGVGVGAGEFLLYRSEDGGVRIECRFDRGTVWLSQAAMAELFQTSVPNVSIHLKAIYRERELSEPATIKDYLTVRTEGGRRVSRRVRCYSLDAILAVGYRVRSARGTQFRQWATTRLSEYVVKGFAMDDERLKRAGAGGDYFDELLARIRDIRASERRMYLRLREILALAADYSPSDPDTAAFFQAVRNKLHFAVTGRTAPELIAERADASRPNMGLTTWGGAAVRRSDVTVAKNYLREGEIEELNRLVVMFLDHAEDQARRRKQVFMCDWRERLDAFLAFNERRVLPDLGRVKREEADGRALGEYQRFEQARRAALEEAGEAEIARQLERAAREIGEVK